MNGFSTLTKFNIKNQFKPKYANKKEKNKFIGLCVLLGVCFLVPIILLCFLIYTMTGFAYQNNILPQFISMIFLIAQIAIIIFGLSAYLQIMYFSRDNEFLLTLPVRQTDIYLSKLVSVLLSQMLISTLIILPSSIVMIAALVKINAVITPVFYLLIPIAILLMPLLPILLISILSFPIAKLITYFKKKPLLGTIVSAVLVCGILCAIYIPLYTSSAFNGTAEGGGSFNPNSLSSPIANIGKYSFHTFVFAKAMLGINFSANFFTFLGITLSAFLLGVGLSIWLYINTIRSLVEGTGVVVKKKDKLIASGQLSTIQINADGQNTFDNQSSTSQIAIDGQSTNQITIDGQSSTIQSRGKLSKGKTLSSTLVYVKKELKTLARNTQLSLTSVINLFIAPVMLVIMGIAFNNGAGKTPVAKPEDIIMIESVIKYVSIMLITMMVAGANNIANFSFSREGAQLELLKTLPMCPKEIIMAKLYLADIASVIGNILCALVLVFTAKLNAIDIICLFTLPTLLSGALNALSLKKDLSKPHTDWLNIKQLSRKTKSPLLIVLLASVCGVVTFIIGLVLAAFMKNQYAISAIYWSIFLAFSLAYYFLFRFKIVDKCENIFRDLEI